VKIYVTIVKALRKKERQDETQFTTKIGEKTSLGPNYFVFVKFSFPVKRLMPYYTLSTFAIPTLVRQIIN
jgi:hypothetical protein